MGQEVRVELKNELAISGTLASVDQFLNLKLHHVSVAEPARHPHLASVQHVFIRGSVVRYIVLPASRVDVQLLHDSTRIEARAEGRK